MGGTPSGIETLVPRVKAKIGFPGFEFLEPGLQNELRTQMKPPSGIGLKRGSRGARLLTQLRPFSIPGLKTIGALAAPFAPTGIMAFLNRAKTDKELDYIRSLNEEFGLSGEAMDPDRIAEIDKERKRLSEEGNEISFADNFKIDIKKAPEYILKAIGTDEARKEIKERKQKEKLEDDFKDDDFAVGEAAKVLPGETALEAVLREGKVLAEKRADKKDVPTSKDTQPGGDVKEDSFETEYDKQYKRVEKYLGKDVDKGEIAIALSDAIGTPGTLADKAAVLNKFLLRKSAGMKKDKRDMAKLAYAATVDLEKAQIAAGKKSQTEKLIDRARVLSAKKERTTDEDLELKLTRSALGDNKKLANLNQVLAAGKDVRKDITNYKEQLSVIEKLEGGAKEQAQNTANSTKQDILSTIQILKSYGVDDATLRGLFGDDLKLFLAEGGRVEMAMGGATEASANPIDTKLTFEQLRTRLPKEITDDIVRLVANSEEALQDFAYIRTQGDVEKFNVKYGVNLVLPQNTA
jgi:hypothetical protein